MLHLFAALCHVCYLDVRTATFTADFVVTGRLAEAANNFELCYSLTKGKTDWLAADGETSMHSLSCSNLTRIYTSIASLYREQNDQEASLQYLICAYEKSKEGRSFGAYL